MCKRESDGFTRKQRKILRNPEIRAAADEAIRQGVPRRFIVEGLDRYSYSGEMPNWRAAKPKPKR